MRLFLAAPSDIARERDAVRRVVDRLNAASGAAPGSPEHVELVDWSRYAGAMSSLPEDVVLQVIQIDANDLFIGLAWLRFDAPREIAPAGSDDDPSPGASERDFDLAFRHWREVSRRRAFFFRCMRLPRKLSAIDGAAFAGVTGFFDRLNADRSSPIGFFEYIADRSFEASVERRLEAAIADGSAPAADAAPTRQPVSTAVEREFERRMDPGTAYEVSFLAVTVAGYDRLAAEYAGRDAELDLLLKSLKELILDTAAGYGGELFTWNGHRGLVIFWRPGGHDHTVMSALKVLHNLPVFNLDARNNPLAATVEVLTAAHDAVLVYQAPPEKIASPDLDFVINLRDAAEPGELAISQRLHGRLDERLQARFQFSKRLGDEPIYSCRLPVGKQDPRQIDRDEIVRKLRHQTSQVQDLLDLPKLGTDDLGFLAGAVDEAYATLNKFCIAFSQVDRAWPAKLFADLGTTTDQLIEEETGLWSGLRGFYTARRDSPEAARIEGVVRAASRRRSRSVVLLERLAQRCKLLAQSRGADTSAADAGSPADAGEDTTVAGRSTRKLTASAVDDALAGKLKQLIKADALDDETLLAELLVGYRSALAAFVQDHRDDALHAPLLAKLWRLADLVRLDEIGEGGSEASAALAAVDPHFRLVEELLEEAPADLDEEALKERFERARLTAEAADVQIVWRCLLVAHGDSEVRSKAAFALDLSSLWQVIAHPDLPVPSLHAAGERFQKRENEDAQKVFFDCSRATIEQAVQSFRTRGEFNAVTQLILLLLNFPFLVETGYFERFDDLLRRFLERAQKAGLKVEYFEGLRKTLETARTEAGDKGPPKAPSGIKELPLTIQRRLAGEPQYVYWFVSHPDPRIAGETLRHIGLMNVERVLRLREVNVKVINTLLRKPELFTRPQAVQAALNHPKCTQQFANRYLPNLGRSRGGQETLTKISRNPSANPAIRAMAKRAMTSGRVRVRR